MLISSRALQKLLPDLSSDADETAGRLREIGLEVEEVTPLRDLLAPVVVGRLEAVTAHPNADRLRICQVEIGEPDPLQIVTGAPNVREGGFYPVIRSGTTLPGGTKIKKGKLRGEVSQGMLGSADELELGSDSEGIMEIEGAPVPGTPLPEVVPVEGYMFRVAGVADPDELASRLSGTPATEVQIDLFADIACPWCYIGEQRLAAALAGFPDLSVVWRWRPFQLQRGLPPAGVPWAEFVANKFGADAASAFERVREVGGAAGLDLRFDRITRAPNTVDAHRLILLAQEADRGREAAEALFRAYFTEGRDVTDLDVLAQIATEVGLDEQRVRSYLAGERGRDEVVESQEMAGKLGISGVPFYIFNGRVAISGAQESETFTRAIEMSLREDG